MLFRSESDIVGVVVFLGKKEANATLSVDQFFALKHFITNFNLSTESSTLLMLSGALTAKVNSQSNRTSTVKNTYTRKK